MDAAMRRSKSVFRLIAEPLLVATVLAFGVRAAVRIYSIPSSSMAPTLRIGDHIVVTPLRGGMPKRGDVVVFRSPTAAGEVSVKRVIALPGDLIETASGEVHIGGKRLAEPYLLHRRASGVIAPQVIPADCLYVMGDNRAESYDSRHWGILQRGQVVGRARLVLWSSGDGTADAAHSAHASTGEKPRRRAVLPARRFFKWVH